MYKANNAGMSSDWEMFVENGKLSAWASAKVRECYDEVEQEDEGRKSIAAQILQTRNEADHRASPRTRRSHKCHTFALVATDTRLKTTSGGLFGARREALPLVVCGTWRPVLLEGLEQNLGHTRQHGPPRSRSVSSTRGASRSLWQLDHGALTPGTPAERW